MNAVEIDVWADVVCPWCYLGKRRLELAIAESAHPAEVTVTYHAFEGIALDHEERVRLVADLGPTSRALILRNHGLVTLGRSVAEAFVLMHNLERACRVQVAIQGTGQAVNPVPEAVCELTARQYDSGDTNRLAAAPTDAYAREWRALLQRL